MKKLSQLQTVLRAGILSAAILVFAFLVLPWASTLPNVKARIDRNNNKNIDGGATFYTDHEFLTQLLLERERNR